MWHTSRGDRTLLGAEAELVGHAVDTMIDALITHIDDDHLGSDEGSVASECQTGIPLFDNLSPSQRIALLHDVTKYLLTPTDSPLPLSAHAESVVAAIFNEIRDQVAIEIDLFPDGPRPVSDNPEENVTWRQLVLAAHKAVLRTPHDPSDGFDFDFGPFPSDIEIPNESCTDIGQWQILLESLTDAVLWDRDFELADSFLDIDPGVSRRRRRLLGIEDDYFTQIAPDPSSDETFRLAARTQSIVRSKPR